MASRAAWKESKTKKFRKTLTGIAKEMAALAIGFVSSYKWDSFSRQTHCPGDVLSNNAMGHGI